MKKFIFSLLSVILAMTARAQLAEGDYVIQNVKTGYFLGGGNDWGTHASLLRNPQIFSFAGSDNVFTLDSHQDNGGGKHFLGTGLYVDALSAQWTFTATSTDGVYTIHYDGNYLAGNGINQVIKTVTDNTDTNAQWKVISTQTLHANMAQATLDNPQNVTFLIGNHEFKRNAGVWTVTSFDGSANAGKFNYGSGGNNANCGESWKSNNGFKATQTLSNLPAGVYQLDAQAFYNKYSGADTKPYFKMNSAKCDFPVKTGDEESMAAAYQSFLQGKYPITPLIVRVEEQGSITLEVASEHTDMWCIFGELNLTYYGTEADINAVKNLALAAKVKELLAEASTLSETLADAKMDAKAKNNLIEIVKDENQPTLTTEEEYNAYIEKLIETINNAKSSVAEYAQAPKTAASIQKYAEAAGINLNTASYEYDYQNGYLHFDNGHPLVNEYNEQLAEILSKTINKTDLIQNPSFETKDEKGAPDMSAWTGPKGDKDLHAATNKNFGMRTGDIFVEKWTPGPGTLTDETLGQTITLPAGKYILTAEAQLLQQGEASVVPGGFFLFAGENKSEITNLAATIVLPFTVEEETPMAIGAKIEGCTGNWASIDNFRLFQVIEPTALNFVITPESGVVESLQTITITPGVDFTVADDANIAVYCGRQQVGGWNAEAISRNTADGVITLTFPMEIKTPGVYTLDIPEGTFLWGEGEYNATYQKRLWEIAETPMAAPTFTTDETGAHLVFEEEVVLLDEENPVLSVQQNGVEVAQVVCSYNEDYSVIDLRFSEELPIGDYTIVVTDNFFGANDRPGVALAATEIHFTWDVPTAIGEVAANGMKDGKFLKNNRIVIVRNGKAYDAAGARIQK